MSSSHNSPRTIVAEPSAEMAAKILRERIGQENVTQSSVLASRRLDEALLRLERASVGNPTARSRSEPAAEQTQVVQKCEQPAEPESRTPQQRIEPAILDPTLQTSEMSSDAIESLFGCPIDVMILSTKAKIAEDRVLQPNVTPEEASTPESTASQPSVTVPQPRATVQHPSVAPPQPSFVAPHASVTEPEAETEPAPAPVASSESRGEFVAAWQVDEFIVPSTIDQLFLADSLAEQLAARLAEARSEGLQTIAITSAKSREGRSTVALGLALSIAFSGLRVALVDADRDGVRIASDLQLELDHSWVEAIRTQMPLEEIAVTSQADALTLLPLLDSDSDAKFEHAELGMVLTRLKQSFDMIVVDCGASALDDIMLCGTALIVRDAHRTETAEVETLSASLRERGVIGVGVIENFCS